MTQRVEELLALGAAAGLSGFASKRRPLGADAPPAPLRDDATQTAAPLNCAQQALALARSLRLSGHTGSAEVQSPLQNSQCAERPTADGSGLTALDLAGEVGLLGVERRARSANPSMPQVTAGSTHDAPLPVPTPPAVRPASTASAVAITAAKPLTKQAFAVVDIAAGAASAFDALEKKMGATFAATIGGQRTWLERFNPDGSSTRAYPAMGHELGQLRDLAGPLGSASVRLAVASISRSDFAVRTTAGSPAPGAQVSIGFMTADVPAALRKALGR